MGKLHIYYLLDTADHTCSKQVTSAISLPINEKTHFQILKRAPNREERKRGHMLRLGTTAGAQHETTIATPLWSSEYCSAVVLQWLLAAAAPAHTIKTTSDGTNHRRFGFGQIRKFPNFPPRIFGRFGDLSDSSLVEDGSVNLVVKLANAFSCVSF